MAADICTKNFKTQDMCNEAVHRYPYLLQYVPDWFATREGVDMWYDDCYDHCDDGDEDIFFEWYEGLKSLN